jgi:hypothetical protein
MGFLFLQGGETLFLLNKQIPSEFFISLYLRWTSTKYIDAKCFHLLFYSSSAERTTSLQHGTKFSFQLTPPALDYGAVEVTSHYKYRS